MYLLKCNINIKALTLLQKSAELEQLEQSEMPANKTRFLRSHLVETEAALHVERVVVNELRSRLVEEHTRYMDQRIRADTLARDLAGAKKLNNKVQVKFNNTAYVSDLAC